MGRLRTVLFGSASRFTLASFLELASRQQLVALVLPERPVSAARRILRGLAGRNAHPEIERAARERGVPVLRFAPASQAALAARLRQLAPDLMCVSLFPHLLAQDIIAVAPLGAINLHPSLLPRHRGPLPLFWTYHAGDDRAGVSVHHVDARFDAGDVILRQVVALPRAYPAGELDRDLACAGAVLLGRAVQQLAAGSATREPQDERAATSAPLLRAGACMVHFEEWDVAQVHHFLAGLAPRYREPLRDARGRVIAYRGSTGFEQVRHGMPPGTTETLDAGWRLYCRGGMVNLI
jgi:methionyl-tRNA formyltransferase